MKPTRAAGVALCIAAMTTAATCKKRGPDESDWNRDPPRPKELPPEPEPERAPEETKHPRMVLTDDVVKRIKKHAAVESELWKKVRHQCKMYSEKDLSSGYLGAFWSQATLNLTLCWKATGDKAHLGKALHYLNGLLDDKRHIGDGQGGDEVIRGNKGYPIRNYGVAAAIAYDWLYDQLTPELKKKIRERLKAWISWYGKHGYLNDSAYSNYFWGYMTTLSLAALAVHGDDPVADEWLKETRTLLDEKIVPGFYTYLRGGEWPEGWQYGSYVAAEVAFVVRAFQTSTGIDYAESLPWLAELVPSRLHRMRPDGVSAYGNGTQNDNPAPAKPLGLYAALLALEHRDPDVAARARFLAREIYPQVRHEYGWIAILADDPEGQPRVDPRQGAALSYHMEGPGLTLARSSWKSDAYWVSFQAGPKISIDHQNQDQGHFELWRGKDQMIGDLGAEHSSATLNHNSILIDDGEKILPYAPNQGVWGKKVMTESFFDDGEVVVVVGDLTDAWSPKCVKWGCDDHEVVRAVRRFVYVRPGLVVTDDEVELEHADVWVAWAGHMRSAPKIDGKRFSAAHGKSRVDIVALDPADATLQAPKEPTVDSNHPFRANRVAFDSWRGEIVTPKGSKTRGITVWVSADAAGAPPADARAVQGQGIAGGAGTAPGGQAVAVLFARADAGKAAIPASTRTLVVAALEPEKAYELKIAAGAGGCEVALAAGGGRKANAGGFLRVALEGCAVAR